jgi:hypothetical protein
MHWRNLPGKVIIGLEFEGARQLAAPISFWGYKLMATNVIGRIPTRSYTDWDAERPFQEDPKKNKQRNTFEIDKGRIILPG